MNTRRIGATPKEAFWCGLKGGIFDAKHTKAMGSALWLFGYLVLRQTQLNEDGEGVVRYGNPTSRADIAADTGWSDANIKRWTARLVRKRYIRTVRSGNDGLMFFIKKGKNKAKNPKPSTRNCSTELHANRVRKATSTAKVGREMDRPTSQVGPHLTNGRVNSVPTCAHNPSENQSDAPSATTLISKNLSNYNTTSLAGARLDLFGSVEKLAREKQVPRSISQVEMAQRQELLWKQSEEIKAKYGVPPCG